MSPARWAALGGVETQKALALWAAREAAVAALADSTAQSQIVAIQRSASGDGDAVRIAELMQEAQSALSAEERAVFDSVKHQRQSCTVPRSPRRPSLAYRGCAASFGGESWTSARLTKCSARGACTVASGRPQV